MTSAVAQAKALATGAARARRRNRANEEVELRELMVGYQSADRHLADQLVRRLTPLLFSFFFRSGQPGIQTEDLVQDCWLRIHKSRHTYRPAEPLLPWIFAIARHTALDGFRRRGRQESREVLVESPDQLAAATQTSEPDMGGHLSTYVQELPPRQREVIIMLKVSGMTLEEVACATTCSVGTVKQRAHRAYKALRRRLGEDDGTRR